MVIKVLEKPIWTKWTQVTFTHNVFTIFPVFPGVIQGWSNGDPRQPLLSLGCTGHSVSSFYVFSMWFHPMTKPFLTELALNTLLHFQPFFSLNLSLCTLKPDWLHNKWTIHGIMWFRVKTQLISDKLFQQWFHNFPSEYIQTSPNVLRLNIWWAHVTWN